MKSQKKGKTNPKKRNLPALSYNVYRLSDYESITHNKKTNMFLFMNLLPAIKDGIESGAKQVAILKLKGSNSTVLLNREDWKKSLNKAIEFFAGLEKYENCQQAKELLDVL